MQFVDLGLTRPELASYLAGCGYWGSPEKEKRHGYVLSPCAYVVSPAQHKWLDDMSRSTFRALANLQHDLCSVAKADSRSNADAQFLSLATRASRGLLTPHDGCTEVPPYIKVDLVQTPEGAYRIVEVDAHNPRGLPYIAFLEGTPKLQRHARYRGIETLCTMLRRKTAPIAVEWTILVAHYERYYLPAFEVLCDTLNARGIRTQVVEERNAAGLLEGNQSLHLLSIPESLCTYEGASSALRDGLMEQYRRGIVKTLFPPAAYLGSKAFLPYLRQQPGMDAYIPPSALIGKGCELPHVNGTPVVLKKAMSAGMKGVVMPGSPDFAACLDEAQKTRPSWILQDMVEQEPLPVTVFTESGDRTVNRYYLRVTAYASQHGIIYAEVTGRQTKDVHGAPDCIQIPTILA